MKQEVCLNLHERYVNNWSTWEVVRELWSNAKDASPDGFSVNTPDADTLIIETETIPNLGELFVIGCGSKDETDGNIGQFGEGLKLAALTATKHGSLILQMPDTRISFEFRTHLGEKVLFAILEDAPGRPCFSAILNMPKAGIQIASRTIDGSEDRIIGKPDGEAAKVFCKGIWISDIHEPNVLFSYNLNGLSINRDRSMAESWSLKTNVGRLLLGNMDIEMARRLHREWESWESSKCLESVSYLGTAAIGALLWDAFRAEFGATAVLLTDYKAAAKVSQKGFIPKNTSTALVELMGPNVIRDVDVLPAPERQELDCVPIKDEWRPMIDELRSLSEMCGVRFGKLLIFHDKAGALFGRTDLMDEIIWLNERMMSEGMREERLATFLHELGHIQSRAADETSEFENGLTILLGRLAAEMPRSVFA